VDLVLEGSNPSFYKIVAEWFNALALKARESIKAPVVRIQPIFETVAEGFKVAFF
jgi:hypothetical protein